MRNVSLPKGPGVMQKQHSQGLNNGGLCLFDCFVLVIVTALSFTNANEKQNST